MTSHTSVVISKRILAGLAVMTLATYLGVGQESKNQAKGKPATAANIAAEAKRQQDAKQLVPNNVIFQSQTVCAGSAPSGWVTTNDSWNPTTCGNPSSIVYNVWVITQYSTMPVGSVLNVCSGYQPVPNGWAVVGSSWNPTACGHPSSIVNNITAIKRLQ